MVQRGITKDFTLTSNQEGRSHQDAIHSRHNPHTAVRLKNVPPPLMTYRSQGWKASPNPIRHPNPYVSLALRRAIKCILQTPAMPRQNEEATICVDPTSSDANNEKIKNNRRRSKQFVSEKERYCTNVTETLNRLNRKNNYFIWNAFPCFRQTMEGYQPGSRDEIYICSRI